MLDKKDLNAITIIVDKSIDKKVPDMIIGALGEFFEKVLAPYLDQLTKRHDEHDRDFDKVFRKLERNEDQHDEILQDQDKIEKVIKDYERRINRVETITAA